METKDILLYGGLAIVALFVIKNFKGISNIFGGVGEAAGGIGEAAAGIGEWGGQVAGGIGEAAAGIGEFGGSVIGGIGEAAAGIGEAAAGVGEFAGGITEGIGDFFNRILGDIESGFGGVAGFFGIEEEPPVVTPPPVITRNVPYTPAYTEVITQPSQMIPAPQVPVLLPSDRATETWIGGR